MGSQYTYLFADVRTGAILDELPLTGVSFSKALNDSGALRARLPVSDPVVRARNPRLLTEPARTAVYVDRDGLLVWGGVVWTAKYSASEEMLDISASDFLSYFGHRRVLSVPPGAPVAFDDDQLAVAQQLIELCAVHPGGDLDIRVHGAVRPSGVRRAVTYHEYQLKPVADALQDLAGADDGFDFVFDVAHGADGRPERRLLLGYPRLGQPGTPHVWEYGANLIDFDWPRDGSMMATRVFAQGAGSEEEQLLGRAEDPSVYEQGWPLLEDAVSQIDIEDQAVLAGLAGAELAARRYPVVLPELTVRADLEPELGTYAVGDDARIVVDDPFFATAMDVTVRIVGFEVTPGDDGGDERVKLTVTPVGGQTGEQP